MGMTARSAAGPDVQSSRRAALVLSYPRTHSQLGSAARALVVQLSDGVEDPRRGKGQEDGKREGWHPCSPQPTSPREQDESHRDDQGEHENLRPRSLSPSVTPVVRKASPGATHRLAATLKTYRTRRSSPAK